MVSPQNPNPTDVAPATVRSDRGFTQEEITTAPHYSSAGFAPYMRRTSFWGSVIAGTLLALSIFVLSFCLMIGCHVGVVGDTLSLGWGSAVWIAITSCIAFYFGGLLACGATRRDTPTMGGGWMTGVAVWALSIPLTFCIWGLAASGTGLLADFNLTHSVAATAVAPAATGVMFGYFWTAFTVLSAGLLFAIFGSATSAPRTRSVVTNH